MTLTLIPRAVSSSIAGTPASVAGTLIITFGRASRSQSSTACATVPAVSFGEVGRALEGDEPVAPGARVVGGAQQVGGSADVLERELEEQLLRVTDTGGDRFAKLVVIADRSR